MLSSIRSRVSMHAFLAAGDAGGDAAAKELLSWSVAVLNEVVSLIFPKLIPMKCATYSD